MSDFSIYAPAWQGPLSIKDAKALATVWLPYTSSLCYLPDKLEFCVHSTAKILLENIAGDKHLLSLGTNSFEDRIVYIYPLSCEPDICTRHVDLYGKKLDYVPGLYGKFSCSAMSLSAEMLLIPECEELQKRLLFMPESVPYPRIFMIIVKCFDSSGIPLYLDDDCVRSAFNSPIHDQLFTQWEDSELIYSPFRTPDPPVKRPKSEPYSPKASAMPSLPIKKLEVHLYDFYKDKKVGKSVLPKFDIRLDKKSPFTETKSPKEDMYHTKKWFTYNGPNVLNPLVSCKKLNDRDLAQYLDVSSSVLESSTRPDEFMSDLDHLFDDFSATFRLNKDLLSFCKDQAETMLKYGNSFSEGFSKAKLKALGYACAWRSRPTTNIIKELRLVKVSSDNIEAYGGLIILLEDDIDDFLSSAQCDLVNKKNVRIAVYSPSEDGKLPPPADKQLKKIFHKKSLFVLHHSVIIDGRFGQFCEFVLQENMKRKLSIVVVMPILTLQFVIKLMLQQRELNDDFYTARRNLFSLSSLIRGGWCILAPYENVGPSSSLDTLVECAEDIHVGFEFAHKEVSVVIGHHLAHMSRLSGYYKIKNL